MSLKTVLPFHAIPAPPKLPILGNWHLYKLGIYSRDAYHKVLNTLYEKYGPIVKEQIGPVKPVVHIFEPEDVKTIYRAEDKMPTIFPLLENIRVSREKHKMSLGLGFTNGEEWYRLKNGIRDLLLKAHGTKPFVEVTSQVSKDLVTLMKIKYEQTGTVSNLEELLANAIQESSAMICLNTRLKYLEKESELGRKIYLLNKEVFRLGSILKFSLPFYKLFTTPTVYKFNRYEHIIYSQMRKYIESTLENLRNSNRKGDYPFLEFLISNQNLSSEDIVTICISVLTDGLSTTLPTLLNNLYAVARNQEVQENAYREILSLGEIPDPVDYATLDKLSYLRAVIKETFRMYPNGTEIARITQKPLVLSGYVIPEQTWISMNMLVQYRSGKYFTEPNKFKPERWLRNSSGKNLHPYLLNPFGVGARTCAGRRIAEQELLSMLFSILRIFRLDYPKHEPELELTFNTLLFPSNELPILFYLRQ